MEIRVTTEEQEKLVMDNMKFVHYLVNRMVANSCDYEELVSIGTIGLIKAAVTFDKTKDLKFSTYAATCINNEIRMSFRKNNKHINNISLEDIVYENGGDDGLTLESMLSISTQDIAEDIENNEEFEKVINIVLNLLTPRDRTIMLYRIADKNQCFIAKEFKISQSYISRLEAKIHKNLKEYCTTQQHYRRIFKMEKVGNTYSISFSSKDVKNFNKILATFFEKMETFKSLPDFRINCNNERVVILLPADLESFSFVARIMQEIDNFSITFESDKNTTPAINNNVQNSADTVTEDKAENQFDAEAAEEELAETNSEEKTAEENSETKNEAGTPNEEEIEENDNAETISTKTVSRERKGSDVKQIRDYIMTLESFSTKELKHHFPDFNSGTIGNALHLAKTKGLIEPDGRGKYVVKKT